MSELLEKLVGQLGISEEQAAGGAGLLLNLIKDKLPGEEFSKLTEVIPDMENLQSAAPESGGGLLGGITRLLGGLGGGGSAAGLAGLAGGFSKLGLDASMVTRFAPVLLEFIQEKGGSELSNAISGVLGLDSGN